MHFPALFAFAIFTACLGFVLETNAEGFSRCILNRACGRGKFDNTTAATTRIFNGSDASTEEFPFTVSILVDGNRLCTGSVITDRFVLTAAHCIQNYPTDGTLKYPTSRLSIRIGPIDPTDPLWTVTQPGYTPKIYARESEKVVVRQFAHPQHWNSTARAFDRKFDIALLEVQPLWPNTWGGSPVCLSESEVPEGTWAVEAGYGLTDNGYKQKLQKSTGNVLYWNCASYGSVPKDQICLNSEKSHPGSGDSGGPLVTWKDNVYTQAGVVTHNWRIFVRTGPTSSRSKPMALGVPVNKFFSWIKSTIETNGQPYCTNPDGWIKYYIPNPNDRCKEIGLAAINFYRRKHGVPALIWDTTLEASAKAKLTSWSATGRINTTDYWDSSRWENSLRTFPDLYYPTGQEAADIWYRASSSYSYFQPSPNPVSHFTGMIWKSTTRVGLACAKGYDGYNYIVAHFSPRGNTDATKLGTEVPRPFQ